MHHQHKVFVVSGPSGAGKSSLLHSILDETEGLCASVSHTTRTPRPEEQEGREYYFVSETEFEQMIVADMFLEYAEVFGHLYGTSKQHIDEQLAAGQDIVLELDWQGARSVRQALANVATIYILPPSEQDLRKRLTDRKQDSAETIESRMNEAQSEMMHYHEFDYVIVNDEYERCKNSLSDVIRTGHYSQEDVQLVADAIQSLGLQR